MCVRVGSRREKKRGKKVEIEGKAVETKSKEGGRRRSRNTLPNAGGWRRKEGRDRERKKEDIKRKGSHKTKTIEAQGVYKKRATN